MISQASVAAALSSGGSESLGWLNDLLAQLWPKASIAIADLTKEICHPIFAELLPGPLKTLHFTKLDLGTVPISLDAIDVHSSTADFIRLNVDISWDGECDIELKADRTPALGIKSVQLKGRLSVVLGPLIDRMPVVSAVKFGFIDPPKLSLDFTGIANVADFVGIDKMVRDIIDNVLIDLMVLPTRMFIKLDPLASCIDAHQDPMGVCRITAVKGSGFKVQGRFKKDVPDVFLKIKFGAGKNPAIGKTTWKTACVDNSTDPEFDQSHDFLLSDHDQTVTVEAWDEDGMVSGDDYLGTGTVTVSDLLQGRGSVQLKNLKGGTYFVDGCVVELQADVFTLCGDLTSLDLDLNLCGVLTVLVAGAKNIPVETKADAKSYVKVTVGDMTFATPVVLDAPLIDALNPEYDAEFIVPLDNETSKVVGDTPVVLTLMNGKVEVGTTEVTYKELLDSDDITVTKNADMGDGAELKFCVSLRGVDYLS